MNKENMIKFSDFFLFFLFFFFPFSFISPYFDGIIVEKNSIFSPFQSTSQLERTVERDFDMEIEMLRNDGEGENILKERGKNILEERGKNILEERGKNILEERRIFSWKRIFVQKMQKMNFSPLQNLVWFPWNKLWGGLVTFSDRKRREDCKKEEEEMGKGEKKMKPHFSVAEKRVILTHHIFCASSEENEEGEKRREKGKGEKEEEFFLCIKNSFISRTQQQHLNQLPNQQKNNSSWIRSVHLHSFIHSPWVIYPS